MLYSINDTKQKYNEFINSNLGDIVKCVNVFDMVVK